LSVTSISDFHIYNEIKYTSCTSQKLWKVKNDIQARITFAPSGKSSTEIKIEIAFIIVKFEIHTLRTFVYSTKSKREKFGDTRE